jgi:chemotaxis signal transduction protein
MQLSLVSDSQSPPVSPLQTEQLSRQLLRFRLRLDRAAQADSSELTELAMTIGQSGSGSEPMAACARQGATELIEIPSDRVVPIPHLPLAVLGVYNWRGEVLWVVDLAVLLGANGHLFDRQQRSYPTIVVKALDLSGELKTLGLVVDEIADIEWCELVSPPVALDRQRVEISRWIKGDAIAPSGTKLTIIDELALVNHAELHAEI